MHPIALLILADALEVDRRGEAARRRRLLGLLEGPRPEARRPASGPTRRGRGFVARIARLDFDRV